MPSERNAIWITLTLFSSTCLLIFPSPTNALAATTLIKQACKNTGEYKDWSTEKCIKTLASNTQISSITNLSTLATTIIKKGVVNATNTQTFIQQKVSGELGSEVNSALEACVVWYKDAIQKFNSSLAIINEDKGYESAMFVLLMAGHDVNYCENLLAATTIRDSSIIIANKIVIIFCSAARQVTTILSKHNKSIYV